MQQLLSDLPYLAHPVLSGNLSDNTFTADSAAGTLHMSLLLFTHTHTHTYSWLGGLLLPMHTLLILAR